MKYSNTVSRLEADENGNFHLKVFHITPAIRRKEPNCQKLLQKEIWGDVKNWKGEF